MPHRALEDARAAADRPGSHALASCRTRVLRRSGSRFRAAFARTGFEGELKNSPVRSEDERLFVPDQSDLLALKDVRLLEQVVTQLLGRKVWIVDSIGDDIIPFS
jgi:hypothetical protein